VFPFSSLGGTLGFLFLAPMGIKGSGFVGDEPTAHVFAYDTLTFSPLAIVVRTSTRSYFPSHLCYTFRKPRFADI